MEFVIVFAIYMIVSVIALFPVTSNSYRVLLEKNPMQPKAENVSEEEYLKREEVHRKVLRDKAKRMGAWISFLWFLTFPIEMIMQVSALFRNSVDKLSLEKHDEEFKNKQAQLKAKRILDEYNTKQKDDFDKLVS